MTTLTSSAFLVGAIQGTNLPVLLLAVPGGVLGDLLNRKKLIIAGQAVMLASAAALGALDLAGLVTPAVLLILLCGVGVGQGLTGPIAQTLQPELVPPSERPQAIALGSVNQNLARAIGPAIGGLLLAATSAALVFFVNAASFLVETWEEHERQHGRATQHDANLLEQLDRLLVPGTHREVHHYLTAPPQSHHRL